MAGILLHSPTLCNVQVSDLPTMLQTYLPLSCWGVIHLLALPFTKLPFEAKPSGAAFSDALIWKRSDHWPIIGQSHTDQPLCFRKWMSKSSELSYLLLPGFFRMLLLKHDITNSSQNGIFVKGLPFLTFTNSAMIL